MKSTQPIRHPLVLTAIIACILLTIAVLFDIKRINAVFLIVLLTSNSLLLLITVVSIVFEARSYTLKHLLWKPSKLPVLLAIAAALTMTLLRMLSLLGSSLLS